MQTPLSTVSVDVPPLLAHVSRVLRSKGKSAADDCTAERTRFNRCKASLTLDLILRLGVRFCFSSSECDETEDDDEDEEVEEVNDVDDDGDMPCVRGMDDATELILSKYVRNLDSHSLKSSSSSSVAVLVLVDTGKRGRDRMLPAKKMFSKFCSNSRKIDEQ